MSAKQLNPAYDGMTDQQVKRFKYWEFRTMAMCIFGYALFYFVRKNLSIAMPYLNEEMGISKSDLGLFLTLHGLIYGLSKFFNGIWGDRSNARYFLVTGLVFCGICNLLFGFSSSVLALGIFWVLNGWFQGMGVPPCTRLMTHWIVPERLATKMSPTDEGVSRTKAQTTAAPRMAIVAGSRKHQRQCCERIDEASNHAPQFRLTT